MDWTGALGTSDSGLSELALGVAGEPESGTSVDAGLASGAGAALGASIRIEPRAGLDTGTGTALDATVSLSADTSVNAELASGSGAAAGPSANVSPNTGLASGTGAALDATASTVANLFFSVVDDVSVGSVALAEDFNRTVGGDSWGAGSLGTWTKEGSTTLSVNGSEAVSAGSGIMENTVPIPAAFLDAALWTASMRFLVPETGDHTVALEFFEDTFTSYAAAGYTVFAAGDDLVAAFSGDDNSGLIQIPFNRGEWGILTVQYNRLTGRVRSKVWNDGDPEPGWQAEWIDADMVAPVSPEVDKFSIFRNSTTGTARFDWVEISAESDVVARSVVLTREVVEELETEDFVLPLVAEAGGVEGDIPTGYMPPLAAPIDDNDTTLTVTYPPRPRPDVPFVVAINGEEVAVTAISPDGLTWTIERGHGGTTPASHSAGSIARPALVNIRVDGVLISSDVDYRRSRFTTGANGQPGVAEIWVRDLDRAHAFVTGAEVRVSFRGVRQWGGYLASIRREYVFAAGSGRPDDEPRWLMLECVDYNVLLNKRVYYKFSDPAHMEVKHWANGTPDDFVIGQLVSDHLQLNADNLSYDITHVGTPALPQISCNPDAPDVFGIGSAGWTWAEVMTAITSQTGAVYYIDPDKVFRYVDDSVKQSAFGWDGVSDAPNNTSTIGYRDVEFTSDGTKLRNDHLQWGAGQGADHMVFHRSTAPPSVEAHGLWQSAEVRYDMYCQESVNLRAQSWVYGSPQNRRGGKDDRFFSRVTLREPYFRVADVIDVESNEFGFTTTAPVRAAEITFPTPWDIKCILTISHELDPPWATFEFWIPQFNFNLPPFNLPPLGLPPFPDPWLPFDPCECAPGEPLLGPFSIDAYSRREVSGTFYWGRSRTALGTNAFGDVAVDFLDTEAFGDFPLIGAGCLKLNLRNPQNSPVMALPQLHSVNVYKNSTVDYDGLDNTSSTPDDEGDLGTFVGNFTITDGVDNFINIPGPFTTNLLAIENDSTVTNERFTFPLPEGSTFADDCDGGCGNTSGINMDLDCDAGSGFGLDFPAWGEQGLYTWQTIGVNNQMALLRMVSGYVEVRARPSSAGTLDSSLGLIYCTGLGLLPAPFDDWPAPGPFVVEGTAAAAEANSWNYANVAAPSGVVENHTLEFSISGVPGQWEAFGYGYNSGDPLLESSYTFASSGDANPLIQIFMARSTAPGTAQLAVAVEAGANVNRLVLFDGPNEYEVPCVLVANQKYTLNWSIGLIGQGMFASVTAAGNAQSATLTPATSPMTQATGGLDTFRADISIERVQFITSAKVFSIDGEAFGNGCDEWPDGGLVNPPPSGGSATGEEPRSRDSELGPNGGVLFHTLHQFQVGSSEVWVSGLRIRIGADYIEYPRQAMIEILDHIDVGTELAPEPVRFNYVVWTIDDPMLE
jgi:hypothetical protein